MIEQWKHSLVYANIYYKKEREHIYYNISTVRPVVGASLCKNFFGALGLSPSPRSLYTTVRVRSHIGQLGGAVVKPP